jgi:hypothetical protein
MSRGISDCRLGGLRLLADTIGVDSADTAMQICAEFFPDENLPPRSAAILQELFG